MRRALELLHEAQEALAEAARDETGNTAQRLWDALRMVAAAEETITAVVYEIGGYCRG